MSGFPGGLGHLEITRIAGEGIRIAGIHHQHPGLATRQDGPAPVDRGRRALGPGQHAGHCCARCHLGDHQVLDALVLLQADRTARQTDPGDRRHGRKA